MKNLMRFTAVALVAGLVAWATSAGATPNCSNLADLSVPQCKTDLKCQKQIQKDLVTYVNKVQGAINLMIQGSQAGTNGAGQLQKYYCMSGDNVGKACVGNNGGCAAALIPCNSNADCAAVKAGDVCKFKSKGCNSSTDASLDGTLDENQCQPAMGKSWGSSTIWTAQNNMVTDLAKTAFCGSLAQQDLIDIGLTTMDDCLIGRCLPGSAAPAAPCNQNNALAVCGAATDCDYGLADSPPGWIVSLAGCAEQSIEGDFKTGAGLVDMTLRPFMKMTGTGGTPPQAKKSGTGAQAKDPNPRQILQLNGSQTLLIGTASGTVNPSQGGAVQALALAHCVGGNNAASCLNNKDCYKDLAGVPGVCTPNPDVCVSNSNDPAGPHSCPCGSGDTCGREVRGAQYVNRCCSGDTSIPCGATGTECTGKGTCGYHGCRGNVLSMQETSSPIGAVCLFTNQSQATNNDTSAAGAINLTTGVALVQSPISTDVYFVACGRCVPSGLPAPNPKMWCDGNSDNANAACMAAAGQLDQGCFPQGGLGSSSPNWQGAIPNPFILKTGNVVMNPAPGQGLKYCGYCSNNSVQGCQANSECAPGTCIFTDTIAGFFGDPTFAQINLTGQAHQYAPIMVGAFCTGETANPLINGSSGLPGPVAITQPYIWAYLFSADK